MSGVVSPVLTWSSAVVTPSVPIDAERCPAMRHNLPRHLDRRGLAVGPGHRDDSLRIGPVKIAPPVAAKRRRGSASAICDSALDHRLGPRHHRHRAVRNRLWDEALRRRTARRERRRRHCPCATLRWSIAKPVTSTHRCRSRRGRTGFIGSNSSFRERRASTSAILASRFLSGRTPSIGAIRLTVRLESPGRRSSRRCVKP